MSLLDRLGSAKAAGLTFAANFWPWLLGAFLLGAGVAGWGGFTVARWIYQGEALRAQRNLAEFDASLAKATANGERRAAERQAEAIAAINARNRAVDETLANIPYQVAAMMAPKIAALRETLNDPKFNCLREPLPAPALRVLERPGGVAPQAGGGADRAAPAGWLPHPDPARTP